jgi:hypothetical protein
VLRGALVSLILVAACGGARAPAIANVPGADPPPHTTTAGGLHPGEVLTYALTTAGLDVGEVAIACGEPGQVGGHHAVIVATRGSATGLLSMVKYMRAFGESTVDLDSGLPIAVAGDVDWGGIAFHTQGRFDGPTGEMDWYQNDRMVEQRSMRASDGNLHSAVSAAAAVRAWDAAPGDRVRLSVAGAFRLWRTDLHFVGPETLHSSRGTDAAVRIDGAAELDGGVTVTISIWLTDDSDRVPLRLIVHSRLVNVTFELTSYDAPP